MDYQSALELIKEENLAERRKINENEAKQKKRALIGFLLMIFGVPMIFCYGIGIIMFIVGKVLRNKAKEELQIIDYVKLRQDVNMMVRVKDEIAGPMAADAFGNGTFSNEMMSDVMQGSNIYMFSEVTCGDGIQGYYDEMAFRIGSVTITEIKNRKEEEHRKNHFEGNTVQIPIKKTLDSAVYVMPKYGAMLNDSPKKLSMDNSSFNNIYDVYTAESRSAFQVLTPSMMEKFVELAEKLKLYAIVFNKNRVTILIKENPISYYCFDKIEDLSIDSVQEVISDNAEKIKDVLNKISFITK